MASDKKIFDSWLVLESQAGSKKAMSLLVKRWHRKLCRHSCWYTKDIDTARDVVQDSWGIILRKIYGLRNPDRFGSWAMSIVTRKSLDWIRKNKRVKKNKKHYYEQRSNGSDNDHNFSPGDTLALVRIKMEELPEAQKMVLHLFYLEEFSIKEISEILEVPIGTVKSRLFKAREQLKTILKTRNHEK
ncbi:MAG: RNA polymerase sigma factor [Bacteroidia bacterium]|nr:RNA polymerase sigma factor [Bacteroidia bacterium]NNF29905.1 RNA polymerase sigma factor [Flavobacteriaceae bacterium]MBT8276889.1 RNA polymerase sigma factor [Bacteroidia bacterium]NNJ81619.1 RNA polymerase sigma factor [Flavobacteriaceae bacterium]NNK55043.1 RNA polymerase sigma factor [Flavobacteriaceae bacterium]